MSLSYTFPTVSALQVANPAGYGGFIAKLSPVNCTYSVGAPTLPTIKSQGGSGTITVTAGAGCSWAAGAGAGWIVLNSALGAGTGTVTYQVGPYSDGGTPRTRSITIAGQSATIAHNPSLRNTEAFW